MRTGNPALNRGVFEQPAADRYGIDNASATMTVTGTTVKTGILLSLAILTAGFTWSLTLAGGAAMPWIIGGVIGGLVLGMVTVFKPTWSPVTAPCYALAEGLFLGGISAMYSTQYHGIVVQAVMLTFGTMLTLLVAYGLGLVRATEKFKAGVFAATGGICLVYLVSFVMSFFGTSIPYIHGSGMVGIGFSLFVVVIAALLVAPNLGGSSDVVDEPAPTTSVAPSTVDVGAAAPTQTQNDQASRATIEFAGNAQGLVEGGAYMVDIQMEIEANTNSPGITVNLVSIDGVTTTTGITTDGVTFTPTLLMEMMRTTMPPPGAMRGATVTWTSRIGST